MKQFDILITHVNGKLIWYSKWQSLAQVYYSLRSIELVIKHCFCLVLLRFAHCLVEITKSYSVFVFFYLSMTLMACILTWITKMNSRFFLNAQLYLTRLFSIFWLCYFLHLILSVLLGWLLVRLNTLWIIIIIILILSTRFIFNLRLNNNVVFERKGIFFILYFRVYRHPLIAWNITAWYFT